MMSHAGEVGSPAGTKPMIGMQHAYRLLFLLVLNLSLCRHLSAEDSAETTSAATEKHWAFVPPVAVVPPSLPDGSSTENPVDALIVAKLRELQIKQVGSASRPELLRRVTFDLTGLPPTTSEREAFLADPSARAWDKVVD